MNEAPARLILLLAPLACLLISFVSHRTESAPAVAFVRYTSQPSLVQITYDGVPSGVHKICDASTLRTAIKMTVPKDFHLDADITDLANALRNGDSIDLKLTGSKALVFSRKTMRAHDLVLLCVPLDPDVMNRDDWEALPGIGPGLARDIISDRHKIGGFGTLNQVERVPGIGPKTVAKLKKYF